MWNNLPSATTTTTTSAAAATAAATSAPEASASSLRELDPQLVAVVVVTVAAVNGVVGVSERRNNRLGYSFKTSSLYSKADCSTIPHWFLSHKDLGLGEEGTFEI